MRRVCVLALMATTLGGVLSACTPRKAHRVEGCAPFVSGQCLTPFPNAWFEAAAKTETGHLVVIPDGVLPQQDSGALIDPKLMGRIDGYSPATRLIAWFPEGVEASQLTPTDSSNIEERIAFMSAESSPIVLIDVAARRRVPLFAELDVNVNLADGDKQALIIHPAVRLDFNRRYAVAITQALHDRSGAPLAPKDEFARWVSGKLTESDRLFEISDRLDEDLVAFQTLGIQKADLALAWDFDTASEASTTGQLRSMVARTLASGPDGFGFTVTKATDRSADQDRNVARRISGTFQVPSFMSGPEPSPLNIDENGEAVMGALADWPLEAIVSQCAARATGPVPLILLGAGLFGSADDAAGAYDDHVQAVCGIGIATDFRGLSKSDLGILTQVLADPNQFKLITGRLEQAHVNYQVLTRLAQRQLGSNPAFQANGHTVLTTDSPVYYWGESNGGIQGTTYLALSDVATRGELIVPGAIWSVLMWRSGDFDLMLTALQTILPDPLDLQLVLAMTQSLWDKTDPIEFAPLLVGTGKTALFQESVGDPVVTNVATRMEMRTIGARALGPLVEPVYGITPENGPLSGLIYTQWSQNVMPRPPYTDQPGPTSNGGHEAVRRIPQAMQQAENFLRTGQVADTCSGMPCIYP